MEHRESKPFSSGTEYEVFLYNWCENCKHYKVRDDGFPEFPEQGGCPVLDAMENARFDSMYWPKRKIVEEWDGGKIRRFHKCLGFEECKNDKS